MTSATLLLSQTHRYSGFYGRAVRQLTSCRFDVRYRVRRLHEALSEHGIGTASKRVLDVGFGAGDLLASFPSTCQVTGVDVSESAVAAARLDERFVAFHGADFACIPEDRPERLPRRRFDVVLTSHALEHVPDDNEMLQAIFDRLHPGGTLIVFVPVEEPDYILFHRRNYSLQSITEKVERAGFEPLHVEGSMYVNGHVWKLLTIPSRRQWPVVRHLADGLRVGSLGLLSYGALCRLDQLLYRLGAGPRQAMVIARRPAEESADPPAATNQNFDGKDG